ncbi:hypothetical protein Hypma_015731 [Hypsizygus marmoreus]|uniref:Uncharacterized protein n=1 Tax=Hypsizygus marmoreus TaxID=39966 RepID=A0A369KAY9_HYPMA|nr:hypothetical protein Hypma_015731 [Hypsizygus marmoreus]
MTATRPRESVLNLFDPLASAIDDRDAPSPDSDKENASPPIASDCSMTAAFFGRTYKQASPIMFKRRLVDVGDVTVDDPSTFAMLTDVEELDDDDDSDEENDTLVLHHAILGTPVRSAFLPERTTPSAPTPRTPLGELSLDRDMTPVARTKMYRRPVAPLSSLSTTDADPPAPSETTVIGSVINSVNASGTTFASPRPNTLPLDLHDLAADDGHKHENPHDIEAPQITVSSADALSDSLCTLNLDTPAGTLLTDTSRPFSVTPHSPSSEASSSPSINRLRPNPPNASAHEKNRLSVDLYSSFQLQLQSEEASFDLLNDKISFLASSNGMDSFLNTMEADDSFDMAVEEANLQSALDNIRREEHESSKAVPIAVVPAKDVVTAVSMPEFKPKICPPQKSSPTAISTPEISRPSLFKKRSSLGTGSGPSSPISGTFSLGNRSSASPPTKLPVPSSPTTASVFAPPAPVPAPPTATYADIQTPAPHLRDGLAMPPPAVPALRIVKRTKKYGHEKSSSSGSASSSEAPSAPEAVPEAPRLYRAVTMSSTATATTAPTLIRHVSAPVAVNIVPPVRAAGPSRVIAPVQSTSHAPMIRTGTGPRRVPIAENPAVAVSHKPPPVVDTTGPRRVLIAAPTAPKIGVAAPAPATAPIAPIKAPATSGLRAPARYGAGAGASALPRPVSRLPAPSASGIARPRIVTGVGSGSQGAGAGRTIPPRRMAYGGR